MAKTTIEKVKLNNWSRSYNINVLSMPLAVAQMLMAEEHLQLTAAKNEWSVKTISLLVASCIMGLGMSVATMWIREAISATSVSVVATCNKFISELVNWVIWNKHTTSDGLWAVLVIMVCGIFYEQAPLRVKGQVGPYRPHHSHHHSHPHTRVSLPPFRLSAFSIVASFKGRLLPPHPHSVPVHNPCLWRYEPPRAYVNLSYYAAPLTGVVQIDTRLTHVLERRLVSKQLKRVIN